ncbi:aerolysin family beta-barrel pore-forming toxin [Clostridium tarantellae]|uniref:Aerolysin family beta-barrel pore-forming toxin n=1 Tax=Clostridium tarantellae TaxID=39493 RepID=A0A6I1MTN5_9CLOT|nr:aerolysin family beta-barrel pore-forming toxin [Clostridium tarantellae]MPQ43599.1 aerolysin family beta-barrel pore-forming toxin [Clostridium tarantellae]
MNDSVKEFVKLRDVDFVDLEEAKYKVCNHPSFIKKWAFLGHVLGYNHCRGSNTKVIGEGYTARKSGEDYILEARNNVNEEGYNTRTGISAYTRLQITVSNIKFYFYPETIKLADSVITELPPEFIGESMAINQDFNNSITTTEMLKYDLMSTVTHSVSNTISSGFEVKYVKKMGTDVTSAEFSLTFNFSTDQTTGTQTEEKKILSTKDSITVSVPPRSKVSIKGLLYTNEENISYTALAGMSYNISLYGALNKNKHAYLGNTFIKTKTLDLGNKETSALEDVYQQYSRRVIPNSANYWDWNVVASHPNFPELYNLLKKEECISVKGQFKKTNAIKAILQAQEAKPI